MFPHPNCVHREEVQVLVGSLVAYLKIQKRFYLCRLKSQNQQSKEITIISLILSKSVHAINTKSIDWLIKESKQGRLQTNKRTCHETLETLVAHRRLGDRVDAGRQHAQSGSFEDSDLQFAARIFSKLFGLVVVGPVNRRCVEPVSYLVHLHK